MALRQMQCPCCMVGLGGTQLRVYKAPSALGSCLLAAESRGAAQPPCGPVGPQRQGRGSSAVLACPVLPGTHSLLLQGGGPAGNKDVEEGLGVIWVDGTIVDFGYFYFIVSEK